MYRINKMRADNVIDYAAEELKKYLRMMMPECGEIDITFKPEATDGFRLGLLEDFGLPNEAPDAALDDIVHIDTTENGGILAGSNPRSVLFAVYRYLRLNGVRFLYPGPDGEHIPRKKIEAQKYHKMADYRYRGHALEGDPSLEQMLVYIDYHAKQELNLFGILTIYPYHMRYYNHRHNQQNRPPEPVDVATMDQWAALYEAELVKRGIQIRGGGHGWISQMFGFSYDERQLYQKGLKACPEEVKPDLAMLKGVRGLNKGDPNITNFCMSRADLRSRFADMVVEYAEQNRHVAQLEVFLADNLHNSCECPECIKKRPSDWMVMILNEIDEKMTAKGLDTKLVYSTYVDCAFPPIQEKLNNPDRVLLQWTVISRKYNHTLDLSQPAPEVPEYVHNAWEFPKTIEGSLALFNQTREIFKTPCISYDYHFWKAQFRDLGMLEMARYIHNDVKVFQPAGIEGSLEDGSNRSFFPNGFLSHIWAETLTNRDCDFETELADYFSHAYGEDWELVRDYLEKISKAFDYDYMCASKTADPRKGDFFNPEHAEQLEEVKEIIALNRKAMKEHMAMPTRPQTVSWRLILRHAEWCEAWAQILQEKAKGHNRYALSLADEFLAEYGKYEYEMERYFDFGLAADALHSLTMMLPRKVEF